MKYFYVEYRDSREGALRETTIACEEEYDVVETVYEEDYYAGKIISVSEISKDEAEFNWS